MKTPIAIIISGIVIAISIIVLYLESKPKYSILGQPLQATDQEGNVYIFYPKSERWGVKEGFWKRQNDEEKFYKLP